MCKVAISALHNWFLTNQDDTSPKPWYMRLKSDFLKSLIAPLFICFEHKIESFLWLMFVIVAGQLGTIINVIQRWVFGGWDFMPSLVPDSKSGSFYTFALVMIASLLGPIFIRIVNKKTPEYRPITIVFVTILIFSLLLCGLFYSFETQNPKLANFATLKNRDIFVDVKQLVFFILAVLFSWYSFGLSLLPEHETDVKLDKDYQRVDDKERNELSKKSSGKQSTQNDQSGNPQKQDQSNFEGISL